MHYEILDDTRRTLLPLLAAFKDRFYLAGGTALALQLGHRDSIDFDFFSQDSFDTAKLFAECEQVFASHTVEKVQEEKNTLGLSVDGVQISFMTFPYQVLGNPITEPYLVIASLADIAAMKCNALVSRSVLKDYVDLYVLLDHISLAEILSFCAQKFPSLDRNLILKSMVYFDDIEEEPIRFTGHPIALAAVQTRFRAEVQAIAHA